MAPRETPVVLAYADVIQVGARNMQNFRLLKELGMHQTPVLLKRGMSSTIRELLRSAEYIMSEGNYNVILCERGIRTFEDATRNTLDLSAVPVLKQLTHLPVLVDPSHGTGKWDLVAPMALAAVAAREEGLFLDLLKARFCHVEHLAQAPVVEPTRGVNAANRKRQAAR